MKTSEVTRLSVEIISKYYQNDLQPFFSYLDEDALWYGPAKGQFLSGRKAILAAWEGEANPLHFTLGDIRVDYSTTNPCY